jgi:two-component system CitB family sensor kinase
MTEMIETAPPSARLSEYPPDMPDTRPWYRRLFFQALSAHLVTVVAVLAISALALVRHTGQTLEREYGERALAVAESVAAMPIVRESVADPASSEWLQPIAEEIRLATGMTFVVIANDQGIRRTHPNPERIGEVLSTDPGDALEGRSGIYVQEGTLGLSVRGKVPIRAGDGIVIGVVSVGILTGSVSAALRSQIPTFLAWAGGALLLGAAMAWLAAHRIRRQTLGLEPDEIASLYEHRQAMLHGIREGVIGLDRSGSINLMNREAARLLGLDDSALGRPLAQVAGSVALIDLSNRPGVESDVHITFGETVLSVSAMPVEVRGERVGSVITIRDLTELDSLQGEVRSVRNLLDGLRAQAHEFTNTLHTVSGLIEIDRSADAVALIAEHAATHQRLASAFEREIGDPFLVALLLAKSAVAAERGIDFRVEAASLSGVAIVHGKELITVIGNLVDNAFDALAGSRNAGGRVMVTLTPEGPDLAVRVADNGPGVDPAIRDSIFETGFSTKARVHHSGIGLALVRSTVEALGGTVRLDAGENTAFEVHVPNEIAVASPVGVA